SLSPDSFTSVRRLKKHSASYAKLPCPSTFWSCPPDIDIPFSWDYFCDIKQTGATSAIIRSFRRYRSYLFVREHAPLWKGVTMTRLLRSSNFWLPNRALLVVISFMIAAGVVSGQTARKPAGPEEEPVFHEYRGVKL